MDQRRRKWLNTKITLGMGSTMGMESAMATGSTMVMGSIMGMAFTMAITKYRNARGASDPMRANVSQVYCPLTGK